MRKSNVQTALEDFFNAMAYDKESEVQDIAHSEAFENCDCRTYEEAGMLTGDNGLVIRTADGQTFYITIQER